MTSRSESVIHSFNLPEGQKGLRETTNLIESGQYNQLAELLRLSQAASERVGQSFLAEMFSAARHICLTCSRSRSEKDLHRQSEEKASGRESELKQQLHTLLKMIDQTTASAISALGKPPDPDAPERDRPSAGASTGKETATSLSIICLGPFRVYRDEHMIQAIYNLRRILSRGQSDFRPILFEKDCYLFNPEISLNLDFEAFEQRVQTGRRMEAAGRSSEAFAEYKLAEELYLGDFLEQDLYED